MNLMDFLCELTWSLPKYINHGAVINISMAGIYVFVI